MILQKAIDFLSTIPVDKKYRFYRSDLFPGPDAVETNIEQFNGKADAVFKAIETLNDLIFVTTKPSLRNAVHVDVRFTKYDKHTKSHVVLIDVDAMGTNYIQTIALFELD